MLLNQRDHGFGQTSHLGEFVLFLYLRIVKTSRLSYKYRDSISNSQFSVLFKGTELDIYVNLEKGL